MLPPPFSTEGYLTMVRGIVDLGYRVVDFHAAQPSQQHLILRHDIDLSIQRARILAQEERDAGWQATYFILMRSEMYNPWAAENAADLNAILHMGHEIGLHFDGLDYSSPQERERAAADECRMLEELTNAPVRLVSFHRPAKELLGGDVRIAGRLHTYMDRFTKEIGYCSDSRGEWRHGHPWEHSALAQKRALQLLTHPVWWIDAADTAPAERLAKTLAERLTALDHDLIANNDVWREKSK